MTDSELLIQSYLQHVKNIMLDVKTSLKETSVFMSVEVFYSELMATVKKTLIKKLNN